MVDYGALIRLRSWFDSTYPYLFNLGKIFSMLVSNSWSNSSVSQAENHGFESHNEYIKFELKFNYFK